MGLSITSAFGSQSVFFPRGKNRELCQVKFMGRRYRLFRGIFLTALASIPGLGAACFYRSSDPVWKKSGARIVGVVAHPISASLQILVLLAALTAIAIFKVLAALERNRPLIQKKWNFYEEQYIKSAWLSADLFLLHTLAVFDPTFFLVEVY